MFGNLLLKEIYDHIRTFRFVAALVTTFAMILISVWVLGDDHLRRRSLHNQLAETYIENAQEVIVPSEIEPVVQRPPSTLGIFARGEDGHLGNAVTIQRWEVPRAADNNLTSNNLLASMPSFDLLTIIIISMSLFGVLFSYDSLSGERERGTLKMITAYPLKRPTLFAVKFLAGVIVLAIPYLFSLICGLLILLFVHGITFTAQQWTAIGVIYLASVVYGALFVAIGLISSVLAAKSSTSLALALLFWTLAVFIFPSVSTNLSKTVVPLKPPQEITRLEQTTSHDLREKRLKYIRDNHLNLSSNGDSGIGGEHPYIFDAYPQWIQSHMEHIRYYEPLYQQRADQIWALASQHLAAKREQFQLGDLISSFAPSTHLRKAVTSLAGTDYTSYERFMETCRRYRRAIIDEFRNRGLFTDNVIEFFCRYKLSDMETDEQVQARSDERMRRHEQTGERSQWDRNVVFGPLKEKYIPDFNYEPGGDGLDAVLGPLAVLALTTLVLVAFGLAAFIRYDVR